MKQADWDNAMQYDHTPSSSQIGLKPLLQGDHSYLWKVRSKKEARFLKL